jgi:hypothetical protein
MFSCGSAPCRVRRRCLPLFLPRAGCSLVGGAAGVQRVTDFTTNALIFP